MIKKPGIQTKYTDDNGVEQIVATLTDFVYIVEAKEGNFIRVRHSGAPGWFDWRDAVLLDDAIPFFTNRIRQNDKDASAYSRRGWAWKLKAEYDKALADYNEAIRLDPKFATAFFNRGSIWRDKKEYDKALADYNEAIRLDPKYATAFFNRGNVWRDKNEYDKALADYSDAIRLDPKYALAFNNRAWLWATCPDVRCRDGSRAVESARIACELTNWKNPLIIDTLAAAYAEAGDFKQAVKYQRQVLDDPSFPKAEGDGARQRLALYEAGKPYSDK
jgi:tetratricopeptide (TPR) repeat protein